MERLLRILIVIMVALGFAMAHSRAIFERYRVRIWYLGLTATRQEANPLKRPMGGALV